VTAVGFAGQFAAYTFVEPFLRDETRTSSGALSLLLLVYGAAGIVGNATASAQAPRHPARTLALAAAAIATAAGLVPLLAHTDLAAAALLAVWGLGIGAFPLCVQLRMFGATPDAPEGGAALLVSAVQVSLAAGALGGGVVVDAVGTSATMWLGAGLVAVVVGLVVAPRLPARSASVGLREAERA
jgi:predicted MFS family arabinose efflux permease